MTHNAQQFHPDRIEEAVASLAPFGACPFDDRMPCDARCTFNGSTGVCSKMIPPPDNRAPIERCADALERIASALERRA